MGIKVTSIAFANELRAETTSWLLGNRKDKIVATIDISVSTVATSSASNEFQINNLTEGFAVAGIAPTISNNNDFADFQVGDSVMVVDYNTSTVIDTLVITDKINDNVVIFDTNIATYSYDSVSSVLKFYVTTPITALRFKYNSLENSDNPTYLSALTGQLQEAIIEEKLASDTSTSNMLLMGDVEWQNGTVQVKGVSITSATDYVSKYQIIHTFFVENWNKFNDDLNRYANGNSLKYIYEVTALYEFTNPNRLQQLISNEVLGNVGDFDENFNNRPTNYFIDSFTYSTGTEIELTNAEQDFTIVVRNTVDTPFSNNNTKFVLHFGRTWLDEDYTSNGKNVDTNFYNDRLLQTVGSTAGNGINFGGNFQVFKGVTATFNSSSQITISGKIALGSSVLTDIPNGYELSLAIQKHSLATADADKVTLLVDRDTFFVDNSDATMIVTDDIGYIIHPYNDTTILNTTPTVFGYDEAAHYVKFHIDKNGRTSDTILLTNIVAELVAKNTVSGAEFSLESENFNLSGASIINGLQYVNLTIPRPYKIPTTELHRNIKLLRRTDLDGGDLYYYDLIYPYQIRWEDWIKLNGVNGAFFDTAENNNGFNNEWLRYDNLANWNVYFRLTINATKNAIPQQYISEQAITIVDFESNTNYTNTDVVIKRTSDDLDTSGNILGFEDNYAEATFELVSGTFDLLTTAVVFFIEQFELGGVNGKERISTSYTVLANSLYKDTVSMALSSGDTILTAKAPINYTQFANLNGQFTIIARVFYPVAATGGTKLYQDSESFEFQDSEFYDYQNI
jgi:hypothetical protein